MDSTLLLSDSYINVQRFHVQNEVEAITLLSNKKAIGALAQSRDFALLGPLPKQEVGHPCSHAVGLQWNGDVYCYSYSCVLELLPLVILG